jgi:predicted nucleic acid-binding protein
MPNVKMSCFVDTNVLVYAADESNQVKKLRAREWLDVLASHDGLVLSPQSINEFYHVSRRRFPSVGRAETLQACELLLVWCTATLDIHTIRSAWLIEEATGYQWFDCVLLASALIADCRYFLSEDLQHGRSLGALEIVDPFQLAPADVLASH